MGNTIDEILRAVLIRSKTKRRLETILEKSLFLVDEARCSSALIFGHVLYLCLSSSSDDHRSLHSCLGTGTHCSALCHRGARWGRLLFARLVWFLAAGGVPPRARPCGHLLARVTLWLARDCSGGLCRPFRVPC